MVIGYHIAWYLNYIISFFVLYHWLGISMYSACIVLFPFALVCIMVCILGCNSLCIGVDRV